MNYIYRVLDYMAWFWFMEWLILVYIINRIIHGGLEIWNLSSSVHIDIEFNLFNLIPNLTFPKLSSQNMRGLDHATILSPSFHGLRNARLAQ